MGTPITLKKWYMQILLPLLFILFFISFAVVMGSTALSMKKQTWEVRQLIRNVITINLNVLQDVNMVYDVMLGEQIKLKLYEFRSAFEEAADNPDGVDLFELQRQWGREWDLYIIDSQNTVFRTTYEPDLGLEFRNISEIFSRRIDGIRKQGDPVLDKITHESQGGRYRKYGYLAAAGGEYLLEVGMTIPIDQPLYYPINPEYIEELYRNRNNSMVDVNVYQLAQLEEYPELKSIRGAMLEQGARYREEWSWKENRLDCYLNYIQPEQDAYPSIEEYFVTLRYPLDIYIQQWKQRTFISITLVLAILLIGLFSILKIIKSLTIPIEIMVQDVSAITAGDWSHPIQEPRTREFMKIKQSVEHLVMALLNEKASVETSERQYRLALDASRDAIFEWFPREHYLNFSDNLKDILGVSPGNLQGLALEKWFYNLFTSDCHKKWKITGRQVLSEEIRRVNLEMQMKSDQEEKWLLLRGAVEEEDGQIRIIGILADITLSKKRERTIETLAYTDPISGRRNLQDFYKNPYMNLTGRSICGFAIINLDDFTRINTTFGHVVGNGIIKEFCSKIEEIVEDIQQDEAWSLYHMNQDNVLIVLEEFSQHRSAKKRIVQLFDKLCKGIYLALEREFYFTVSIGAEVANCRVQKNKKDLVRKADIALFQAKSQGKNSLVFYKPEFSSGFQDTYDMIHHIWENLHNDSLRMVYQPIVDSEGKDPSGFEALLRIGKDNSISPAVYIKASEDSGLIHLLGTWILNESFRQAKLLLDNSHPFRYISVNISPLQFRELDFAPRLVQMCRDSGVPPEKIQIEITETALMESAERMIGSIQSLKEAGFRIALDDFGTGYSSLDYLAHLPIDAIKIEKKMTVGVQKDLKFRRVVSLILQIARELSLEVIAEGVEDWEHVRWMVDHGCTHHQGYYYSKPMDSDKIPNYLEGR